MDLSFSIPVTGVIHMEEDGITITVNKAETKVSVQFPTYTNQSSRLEPGETMSDVVLQAAQDFVRTNTTNRFSGPELFFVASQKHPRLNKASFLSRIVAVTPNHPSYRHFASGKDYFKKVGKGLYQLNSKYFLDAYGLPVSDRNS